MVDILEKLVSAKVISKLLIFFHDQTIFIKDCELYTIGHSLMSMSSVVALLLIVALAYSEETVKSGIPPSHQDPCDVQALISANNANGGKKFHLKVKNNIFLD